jgi:hypothetical protein
VKVMEDIADQEYVEVQHIADHEDPALSDSGYASNIIFWCPTYTLIDTGASRSFVSLVEIHGWLRVVAS